MERMKDKTTNEGKIAHIHTVKCTEILNKKIRLTNLICKYSIHSTRSTLIKLDS